MCEYKDIDDYLIRQPTCNRLLRLYAEKTKGVVVFCGAGPSSEAGIPIWAELVDKLKLEMLNPPYSTIAGARLPEQLEAIDSELCCWEKISKIKEFIKEAQFEAAVRQALTPFRRKDAYHIPSFYKECWELQIAGILTPNLDGLAARAFEAQRSGQRLIEVFGRSAHENKHVISADSPFLVHLHGTTEVPSSWVLTSEQRDELLSCPGYLEFVRGIFSQYTVLFYGISVQDSTISGQLSYLSDIGFSMGEHFWIVRAPVSDTHQNVASRIRAQIIEFPEHVSWEVSFARFCELAKRHKSAEPTPAPVLKSEPGRYLKNYTPEEMLRLPPDEIRAELINHSSLFFDENGNFLHEKYSKFCSDYDDAIHLASRVRPGSPNATWLGYKIVNELGSGVFGKVYSAQSNSGDIVAIKIAREEVRDDRDMLNSFRRGVESMELLTRDGSPGVAKIKTASELPPAIVMEFIEGVNLEHAVNSNAISTPFDRISIIIKIAKIVHRCHTHKNSIFHRDLRPSNIMLSGEWWQGSEFCDVVVLDFDLSWHFGAKEKSLS